MTVLELEVAKQQTAKQKTHYLNRQKQLHQEVCLGTPTGKGQHLKMT
jgi:hypothetical protein